jgi:hypothetical protein
MTPVLLSEVSDRQLLPLSHLVGMNTQHIVTEYLSLGNLQGKKFILVHCSRG